jgi:hypothetical protein
MLVAASVFLQSASVQDERLEITGRIERVVNQTASPGGTDGRADGASLSGDGGTTDDARDDCSVLR